MLELYDNILNDFELKAFSLKYPKGQLKWELISEYKRVLEIVYQFEYKNICIYPRILTREWYKEEDIKELLIDSIKETLTFMNWTKDVKYESDDFEYVSEAVRFKLTINCDNTDFSNFVVIDTKKIKLKLKAYVEDIVKQNNNVSFGEVYRKCIEEFAKQEVLEMLKVKKNNEKWVD